MGCAQGGAGNFGLVEGGQMLQKLTYVGPGRGVGNFELVEGGLLLQKLTYVGPGVRLPLELCSRFEIPEPFEIRSLWARDRHPYHSHPHHLPALHPFIIIKNIDNFIIFIPSTHPYIINGILIIISTPACSIGAPAVHYVMGGGWELYIHCHCDRCRGYQ